MVLQLFAFVTSIFGFAAIKLDNPLVNRVFSMLGACLAISLFLDPIRNYQQVTWFPIWVLTLMIFATMANSLLRNKLLKTIIIGLSFLVFFIHGENLAFNEYHVNTSSLVFVIHAIIGYLLPQLGYLISRIFNKWWNMNEELIQSVVWPYLMGISLFAGFFHYSFAGVLAILLGLFVFVLADDERTRLHLNSLLFISASIGFFGISYINQSAILSSSSFLAVGLSAGAFRLMKLTTIQVKRPNFLLLLFLLVSFLSLIAPLYLGGKNISFGGQGAFILSLFMLSFLAGPCESSLHLRSTTLFFSLTVVAAVWLFSTQNDNYKSQGLNANFDNKSNTTNTPSDYEQAKSSPLNEIIGDYSIAKEGFEFTFELGPKEARTKGAFKKITGEIHIDKELTKSTFNISLPVGGLSTFESSRDEVLMSSDYFFLEKFPTINFKSTSIKEKNGEFVVTGVFTMLGVNQPVDVLIKQAGFKLIGGKKYPVLKGVGSLDRTKSGMASDPSIGNLVNYSFTLLLQD